MAKINEYPQAASLNNNDLFVIDQTSGGDHATKSASVSQIADKATSGVQSQIGNLSTLTTTDKSSLVGAVNEVNASSTASVTPISVTVNSVINSNITKIGKVVHIEYSFSLKAMSGTIQNKTWGTIPEGYRPTSEVIFNAYYISDYASNVETKAILISASSSGSITTPNNGANGTLTNPTTNSRIYMSATYITA